jgi:hypothetical protein
MCENHHGYPQLLKRLLMPSGIAMSCTIDITDYSPLIKDFSYSSSFSSAVKDHLLVAFSIKQLIRTLK